MSNKEDAAFTIKQHQYYKGDGQAWLVNKYNHKVSSGRLKDVTDEEFQAKMMESQQFRESLKPTNPKPF